MKIEDVRAWIEVCEKAGIDNYIPEQVYVLDAYGKLLEAEALNSRETVSILLRCIEQMREALQPFSEAHQVVQDGGDAMRHITLADLRLAHDTFLLPAVGKAVAP